MISYRVLRCTIPAISFSITAIKTTVISSNGNIMKRHLYIITTCIVCVNKSILYGFLIALVIIIAKRDIYRDVTETSCRLENRGIQVRIPAQAETCLFTSDCKPNLTLPNGDRGHFSQRDVGT
jgi:hypothetical protein